MIDYQLVLQFIAMSSLLIIFLLVYRQIKKPVMTPEEEERSHMLQQAGIEPPPIPRSSVWAAARRETMIILGIVLGGWGIIYSVIYMVLFQGFPISYAITTIAVCVCSVIVTINQLYRHSLQKASEVLNMGLVCHMTHYRIEDFFKVIREKILEVPIEEMIARVKARRETLIAERGQINP